MIQSRNNIFSFAKGDIALYCTNKFLFMKNSFYKIILPVAFVVLASAFFYLLNQYFKLRDRDTVRPDSAYTSDGCTNPCTGKLAWIKLSEAIKMVSEYGVNQAANINVGVTNKLRSVLLPGTLTESFKDSRFIVFPMDTLKNFICTIDNMLRDNHPVNANGSLIKTCDLGIKFFYATYPGLDPHQSITNTYKGRHTLILVPSYLDTKTNLYTEFFPSAIDVTTRRPYSLNQLIGWDSLGTLPAHGVETLPLFTLTLDDPEVGRNHGTLCPPPDDCLSAILQAANGN
jgi:hypothetical protein